MGDSRARVLRVVILAAGTGGHLLPALEVARVLNDRGFQVHWLGAGRALERELIGDSGYAYASIGAVGFMGRSILAKLGSLFANAWALLRALRWMVKIGPDAVLGFGGYVCVSGGLAAYLCRVPLLIHEQNAQAGRANRLCAHFAKLCLEGIPGAFTGNAQTRRECGNPVRAAIAELASPTERYGSRGDEALNVLVLGGSQGAEGLNQAVPECIEHFEGVRIWHQSGAGFGESVRERYRLKNMDVRVDEFIEQMADAYGWADLVICRAGAMTLSELASAGVAAIVWPMAAAAENHQAHNAEHYAPLCEVVISKEQLLEALERMLVSRAQLCMRAERMRKLAFGDASTRAADALVEVVGA